MFRLLLLGLGASLCLGQFTRQQGTPAPGIDYKPPFPRCVTYHANGTETYIEYDPCVSFCCGGIVVANSSRTECCGSAERGSPYNPSRENCCQWWSGEGKGHSKAYFNRGFGCCGAHIVKWSDWQGQRCCYGDGAPTVIDPKKELCCNTRGVPYYTANDWDSQCCGDTATFNKATQSCPCNDGTVVDGKSSDTACCELNGMKTSYNKKTQFCCSGKVGNITSDFCCSDEVGTIGEQVCCQGGIYPVSPPDPTLTDCCVTKPFDPKLDICCDGNVVEIEGDANQCCGKEAYNLAKSICCGTKLWSTETEGTECCEDRAFFPGNDANFCCNNVVYPVESAGGNACCGEGESTIFYFKNEGEICCGGVIQDVAGGDQCCGTVAYPSATSFCCDGSVASKANGTDCCNGKPYFKSDKHKAKTICCPNGPFGPYKTPACCGAGDGFDIEGRAVCCSGTVFQNLTWPSCCVDVGYDAKTHICCGSTVYPKIGGDSTSCCQGNAPYDSTTQLCCEGLVVTIPEGTAPSAAQCCGIEGYNQATQLCCDGVMYEKNGTDSECCGHVVYRKDEQICCKDGAGVQLYLPEFGSDNSACCGIELYNASSELCCDGVLMPKSFDESACCAGLVYDRTKRICCDDDLVDIGAGVPWQSAKCCENSCFYSGEQTCCLGSIYANNQIDNRTCTDY